MLLVNACPSHLPQFTLGQVGLNPKTPKGLSNVFRYGLA
jgi:hypothetical protein